MGLAPHYGVRDATSAGAQDSFKKKDFLKGFTDGVGDIDNGLTCSPLHAVLSDAVTFERSVSQGSQTYRAVYALSKLD